MRRWHALVTREELSSREERRPTYRERLRAVPGIRFRSICRAAAHYKDFAIVAQAGCARGSWRRMNPDKKYFRPSIRCARALSIRTGDDLRDTETAAETVLCLPMFNELAETQNASAIENQF
jgi:dTDP-4-amino-4,6-dideoxygalactose transaminase